VASPERAARALGFRAAMPFDVSECITSS
jgi:hypothetical protein